MKQTISNMYKRLNQLHHQNCAAKKVPWGKSIVTRGWLMPIVRAAEASGVLSILDYGSGHGVLSTMLRANGYVVSEYDPGLPEKSVKPQVVFDMVISMDVLEHVESVFIHDVLDEIADYGMLAGFFTIALKPAKHILPNGLNAHQTLRTADWWIYQFQIRWENVEVLQRNRPQLVLKTWR